METFQNLLTFMLTVLGSIQLKIITETQIRIKRSSSGRLYNCIQEYAAEDMPGALNDLVGSFFSSERTQPYLNRGILVLFRGSMRFVSWANLTNFLSSWENGDILGVKSVVPSSTLKMRKSKKIAHVYAYTHANTYTSYTIQC